MKRLLSLLVVIGFLFAGLAAIPARAAVEPDAADPGKMGPLPVTATEYTFGDTAFTPPGFGHAVEVTASVHYPTGLPAGPYPLVLLLHGRHSTCYSGSSATLAWPCTGSFHTIPSYQGYDYLANNLASWGYIVVSVSANGINAFDNGVTDLGALARAELLQHHLDIWNTFNTTGGTPFGTTFVGKVNLDDVGIMGHSRGGEGVVREYLYNKSLGSPYKIKAILPLAPVDFNRPIITGVPLEVILPYCDGDVSDLQGVHFYDDARYLSGDNKSPEHALLVMGADHNEFNTIWEPGGWPAGTADDWTFSGGNDPQCGTQAGSKRLTEAQQHAVGLAYMAGFFRMYLGGEKKLIKWFNGSGAQPGSVRSSDLHMMYYAQKSKRLDVDRFLNQASLTTDQLGGAVTSAHLSPADACGGASPEPSHCLTGASDTQQPHTTPSARSSMPGMSQARLGWNATNGTISAVMPAKDVTRYATVSFRVSVNFADSRDPAGVPRDLSVVLSDGTNSHSEIASAWSDALFAPPGATSGVVPKVLLTTVRIPLSAFSGVDLTHITGITINFDQVTTGEVLLTDLAFQT